MKSILVSLFLLLLINNEAPTTCLGASQDRIFPIGMIDDAILVFETRLNRSRGPKNKEDDYDLTSHWRGITYLKKYSKNNELMTSEIIDSLTLFNENKYIEIVNKSFNKSLNKAIELCDLELFEPVSVSFCDFQNKCSLLSVNVDTVKKGLYIKFNKSKTKYPVNVLNDSTSIAYRISRNNNSLEDSFDKGPSFLDISSIRKFKAGNKFLTVTHLGNGYRGELADGSIEERIEYKPKFEFNKLNESVFIEPLLHHGFGFDFMMIEKS